MTWNTVVSITFTIMAIVNFVGAIGGHCAGANPEATHHVATQGYIFLILGKLYSK